jgi:outer membrane protein assembly factor BamD (BamD/ComL family)
VAEVERTIAALKTEQARGNFEIARFYEKIGKRDGALVYYNEVLVKGAGSPLAEQARERIAALNLERRPAN